MRSRFWLFLSAFDALPGNSCIGDAIRQRHPLFPTVVRIGSQIGIKILQISPHSLLVSLRDVFDVFILRNVSLGYQFLFGEIMKESGSWRGLALFADGTEAMNETDDATVDFN